MNASQREAFVKWMSRCRQTEDSTQLPSCFYLISFDIFASMERSERTMDAMHRYGSMKIPPAAPKISITSTFIVPLGYKIINKQTVIFFELGIDNVTKRCYNSIVTKRYERRHHMDIKAERKRVGMTQSDLAKACGVSRMSITRYEKGTRKPKPATAIKMGKVLGFPWTKFYE